METYQADDESGPGVVFIEDTAGDVEPQDYGVIKSASTPALSTAPKWSNTKPRPRGPLAVSPPFLPPRADRWGFPKAEDRAAGHRQHWNEAHHRTEMPNDLLPKGRRHLFENYESVPELKKTLATSRTLKNTKKLCRELALPDKPDRPRSPITADSGAAVCPERHVWGGSMNDRDGKTRAWNNRWHSGISLLNDGCHPSHRSYFTQKSLFEKSPSQQYRRFLDQENEPGTWIATATKKPHMFPPLGGEMRGRSGTPIPGATM